jgi:MFS transporter, Spinster family, sphingosine-1-phosphate transporter
VNRLAVFVFPAFLATCFGAVYTARLLPGIIAEPLKLDLGLSDTQIGALTGLVFGLAYGLSVFPLARLADRTERRWFITIAMAAAALATLGTGLATGFLALVATRLVLGVAEAAVFPASVSLVADRFKEAERARAMAIYTFGIVFGLSVILWAVGRVAEAEGWRAAFFVCSAFLGLGALAIPVIVRKSGGPQLVGVFSDLLAPRFGTEALGVSLLALCVVGGGWGVAHALAATRALKRNIS